MKHVIWNHQTAFHNQDGQYVISLESALEVEKTISMLLVDTCLIG